MPHAMATDFSTVSPTMSPAADFALFQMSRKMASHAEAAAKWGGQDAHMLLGTVEEHISVVVARLPSEGVEILGVDGGSGCSGMFPQEGKGRLRSPPRYCRESVNGQTGMQLVQLGEQTVDIATEVVSSLRPWDLREGIAKDGQHGRGELREREEFPPCQRFSEGRNEVWGLEENSVELVVSLAIHACGKGNGKLQCGVPCAAGIVGGRFSSNVAKGERQEPAHRYPGYGRLVGSAGQVSKEPHAVVYFSVLADDPA